MIHDCNLCHTYEKVMRRSLAPTSVFRPGGIQGFIPLGSESISAVPLGCLVKHVLTIVAWNPG